LEGVFAQGQVYVLISRVTDPKNFQLLGLPPIDLLEHVVDAWREAGLDVVECLRKCVTVTNEFEYVEGQERIKDKIRPRKIDAKLVPVKNRKLADILNPQPKCSTVLHKLLDYINRCDYASQLGEEKPPCIDENGEEIIPTHDDNLWWLTEMSARKSTEEEEEPKPKDDEDGPGSSEEEKNDLTDDESMTSEDDEGEKTPQKKQKTGATEATKESPLLPVDSQSSSSDKMTCGH